MERAATLRLSRTAARENARALRETRAPGHPRPYFISYLVRDEETWRIQAKYGARVVDTHDRKRNAFVDVRVGSHRYDQVRDGGLLDNDKESESYGYVELPFGNGQEALRHGLWRLTDAKYREAVETLLEKRSHELTYRNVNRHLQAFERRRPVTDLDWRDFPEVDRDHWAAYVERVSGIFRRCTDVKDSHVEFEADHCCKVFVDSGGTRLVQCGTVWSLDCHLWLLSEAGDGLPWKVRHMVTDPAELPTAKELERQVREAVGKLRLLARAPTLRSFCGPALLEPVPAGLLMHEAVGHRLEGSRLLCSGEGQTFKDSLGQSILPRFLSMRDDPNLQRFQGRSLVGHYRYDDEGVRACEAELVREGRLRGFLTTRVGIASRHRSNGHARSSYHQRPISRMGVTRVIAEDGLSDADLERTFLREIRRQNAPFGVRILDATSGETATDAYNFQAFLGEVNLAAKVYPDGRQELIRGVDFVGTPLNAIRGIIAAGRRLEVDNAYCGAESGYVPVSTIAPAIVVSELEMQSKPESPYTEYSLPMPWAR